MADEVLYAGIADLTTVEAIDTKVLYLLADRNAMPNHPAIAAGYFGALQGSGSLVKKVGHAGIMGYDRLSTATEGSGTANTAFTDGSSTITVVPKEKIYEASDITRMIDATGLFNASTFAIDAVVSKGATMLELLAALVGGFSSSVGTSGVDATVRNHIDAITTLAIAGAEGPFLAIYHPRQWGDMNVDATLVSGGALANSPEVQLMMQRMNGLGYKGKFLDVDVFTTLRVPTANAGADRGGGMFGVGGVIWCDAVVPVEADSNIISMEGGKLIFERIRDGRASTTGYKSQAMMGFSRGLDGAGVNVTTDA